MKKYIIVEKDVKTVKNIRTIIDSFDDIMFSESSINQEEALTLIFKNKPDIIFLDIDGTLDNLPEFLLDITQHCKKQPTFIALSASKGNAYDAYRYDFFDYLLKPVVGK